jgi:hypothetical protein
MLRGQTVRTADLGLTAASDCLEPESGVLCLSLFLCLNEKIYVSLLEYDTIFRGSRRWFKTPFSP